MRKKIFFINDILWRVHYFSSYTKALNYYSGILGFLKSNGFTIDEDIYIDNKEDVDTTEVITGDDMVDLYDQEDIRIAHVKGEIDGFEVDDYVSLSFSEIKNENFDKNKYINKDLSTAYNIYLDKKNHG